MMLNTVSTPLAPIMPDETERRASELDTLILQYKRFGATIKSMESDRAGVKDEIAQRIGYFGQEFAGTNGTVKWQEGRRTMQYDESTIKTVIAALETLAPALAAQLKGAVKESRGEPILTIR